MTGHKKLKDTLQASRYVCKLLLLYNAITLEIISKSIMVYNTNIEALVPSQQNAATA